PGSPSSVGQLTVHECSDRVIAVGTALFNNELYKAVRNVTYPGERTALDRITAGFQEYSAAIAVMRHEYELAASKTDPNDPNLRRAYTAYLSASEVLHTRITRSPQADPNGSPVIDEASIPDCTIGTQVIPAALWPQGSLRQNIDCFNFVNKSYLDRAYESTTGYLGLSLALVSVSSLAICALLLFATWRMATITHRLINLGLTLALLGGLAQSIAVASRFAALG